MKVFHAKKLFEFSGQASDEVRCSLGEGPTWNANNVGGHRRTLSWVDINKGKVFLWDTIANTVTVIFVVHLEEDRYHCALSASSTAADQSQGKAKGTKITVEGGITGGGTTNLDGCTSGSGSSATVNGLSQPKLVEGPPTIAGEVENIGFAVPVADSGVFLCGSQHGLFYLRTNSISKSSISSHDDKHTLNLQPAKMCGNNNSGAAAPPLPPLIAKHDDHVATTIRFYTFYITMEQYIYTLPPTYNTAALPKFAPFSAGAALPSGSAVFPHTHRVRFNDAKTDRSGRLFLGTMDTEQKEAIGNLFVLDPEEHVHPQHGQHSHPHPPNRLKERESTHFHRPLLLSGAHDSSNHFPRGPHTHTSLRSLAHMLDGRPTISNGLDWSPCNTKMYYVDTPTRCVDVFDFRIFTPSTRQVNSAVVGKVTSPLPLPLPQQNSSSADNDFSFSLGGRKTLFDLEEHKIEGMPDGLTVDASGIVWVALWGGGKVIGIDPTSASVVAEVVVPGVTNVTSVCFGGPALSWLIITTAAREGEMDSGHVFVAEHIGGAVGIPATEFKGLAFSPPSIDAFAPPRTAAPTVIRNKRKEDSPTTGHSLTAVSKL